MNKIYIFISFIMLVLSGHSQTVLTAGDIAFVGSNSDGATNSDDTFAFVLLKDIDAATTIIFTDRGWNDVTGFTAYSGDGEFTWTSGVARSAGEVVTLNFGPLLPAAYGIIGDQLFAIQGSIASPVFIAGLQFNDGPGDDANWDGSSTTNSTSALPNVLTNGVTAIRLIDAVNGEQDNWQFSRVKAGVGSPISGTPAEIRAIVNNRANWNSNDATVYNPVLEAGCSFVVTAGGDIIDPVITCAADPAPITAGLNGLAAIPNLVISTSATDNVSSTANITITQSPAAGTMAGVGVNLVSITATDEAGNSATCTNNVTINEPASTLLSAGDIAFVGFNLDGNDSFAFILLKDIIAGTNIKLSDCGVSNPNTITCAGTGDGSKTWYAATAMSAGDIVTLPGTFMSASILSSFGDQLFAYQGTATNPVFLAAIHANVTAVTNDADWDGTNINNDDTALPDQLTNGVNAIRLHNVGVESDNWQFNCLLLPPGTTLTGTPAQLAALINNVNYWSFNDDAEFVPAAKAGCAYTVILDVTPPDAVCKDIEVQLDAAGSATILASDVNNGSSDDQGIVSYLIDKNTFSCSNVGTPVTVTLTVADAAGNTDFCTSTVTVKDQIAPTVNVQNFTVQLDAAGNASISTSDINNGSTDACGIASMSVSPDAFTCAEVGANTVTLTVTDNNGNSSTKTATVTVEDKVNPVAKAKAFTAQLDATGNVTILPADVDDGSSDACGFTMSVSPNSFSCAEVGANTVTLTVTDNNGNIATTTATVTVEDNVDPVAKAKAFTAQLDATGSVTILPSDIDDGSGDACGFTMSVTPNSFTCAEVGTNTVTLNVTDNNGNLASTTATVTVEDNVAPVAKAKAFTAQLDATGNVSILTSDIDDNSTDACGIASMSVSPDAFTCANVGANTVTLTVTDNYGNSSTKTATVTVEDKVDPVAKAKNYTAQLDATGNVSILPADIDDGSADVCGIASMSVSPNSFSCAEVGANTVTLTVTDNNGNSATTTATVTVEDNVDPVAKAKAFTAQLDATGNITILPADIDDGSGDACGFTMSVTPNSFTCAEVGTNTVTLNVTDNNGNLASTTATVTVEDNVAPVAKAKAFTAQLDATGNVSILTSDIDDNSTDACGIASMSVLPASFTCASVGANAVVLTVTDIYGNSSTANATVTVQDKIAPEAKTKAFTAQLNALGSVSISPLDVNDGSADNCGIASMSVSPALFTCAGVGTNTVTFTVTDINGNSSSATAVVTVVDNVAPVAKAKAYTAQLDASGNVTITALNVDDSSSDACGIASMSVSPNSFTCADVGANTVTLTVTDTNGNSANTTATVTVEDKLAPVAKAKAFTAQLDATGNVTIVASDVDDNSTDACGIASMSVSPASFSCADIGPHTVTLTVNDNHGNSSTATATVTVIDLTPPVVVAKNFSADLDINGEWEITAAYLLSHAFVSRTDNCGLTTNLNVTGPLIYTCSNKGAQNLTIYSFDNSGNQVASNVTLTINDPLSTCNHPPVAVCKNITVAADNNCLGNVLAADFNNGSSDPDLDPLTFSVSPAGPYSIGTTSVVLTVSDGLLSTTCNATITVVDNTAPVAKAKNITIQLDAAGRASITQADFDNGSSDACGIAKIELSQYDFDCSNVGSNTVTLTVTDNNGNISATTATVTVEDKVSPVAKTKAYTAQLDATGNVTILPSDVNDGSSDACGIASMSVLPNSFTCAEEGTNTVTLTVTDNHGNSSTATAIVTVEDNVAPVAKAKAFTAQLDATGNISILASDVNDGSSDACGIATLSVSPTGFTCAEVGANTVTLTVTDNNGNSSTATAAVTVQDNNAPVAKAKAFTAQLDATGNVTILPSDVDDGSSNTCSFTMSVSPSSFTCSQAGVNTVVLTVTGNNGQTATAPALVTVVDNIPPVAKAKSFTAQLDATGNVAITADDVDAGSNDACGVFTSVLPNKFTCADLGENTVSLYVYDKAGNLSIATATVTVVDRIAPVAKAKAFTAQLDATGNVTISPDDINDGSVDACSLTMSVSPSHFSCAEVGPNTVTLTVTDGSGNSSSATSIVTVEDAVAPIAKAKSITVQLDASGQVALSPSDIDNGSGDACEFTMSVLPANLSCANLGENTVTLYVTDKSGNTSYAKAIVTVEDHIAPVAKAKAAVVELGATGFVTISPEDVNDGSSDACHFTMSVSPANFTCSEIGANTVTLTVTDESGNSSTATATVTVEDHIAPELSIPADIVQQNGAGICGAVVDLGEAISTDNCIDVIITNNAPASFGPGLTEVIWKATDGSGNSTSKIQKVEITGTLPQITGLQVTPVSNSGDDVVATASLSGNNIISATWSWGDGNTSAAVINGTQSSGSHLYSQAGIYSVSLMLENACGDIVHETFNYVVIYNPCNGYIMGNGTLTIPTVSVIADIKITNQADFNFVVRYKKDELVPSGKFKFDMVATDFHVEATSFAWLVVKDDQALLKGDALVNDKPGFHFIASIVDGDITVKNGTDYLRLVVWDNSGNIVFDNRIGDPENARATSPIDKGKIEIHSSKTGDCYEIPTANVQIQDEYSQLNNMIVYPNPVVDGKVTIAIENFGTKDARIDLTSMSGQRVFSEEKVEFQEGKAKLDFKHIGLKPGNYLIRVSEIGTSRFGVKQISVSSQK